MTAIETRSISGSYTREDFSGRDLSNYILSGEFIDCNFDDCNMRGANCEASVFTGSTFRRSILSYANFRNAHLGATVWEPADAYGVTLTMACTTFRSVNVSKMWYLSMLILVSQMQLPVELGEDLKANLIEAIGAVRYVKMCELFSRRDY